MSRNELHPSERYEFSNKDEMAELAMGLIRGNTEKITPNGLMNPGVLPEIAD